MLPLVTATALNYTAPLFLALVLCLRRGGATPVTLALWVGGGLAGVWLVLQPSLGGGSAPGVVVGLLSGATGAIAYLLLSYLQRAGQSESVTGFYFSVVVSLLA